MGFLSVLSFAHEIARQRIQPGEPVVDATCGNGNDTLFLAQATGKKGAVYAFDVQEEALQRTAERCQAAEIDDGCVRLIHCGHEHMSREIAQEHHGKIAAVMFNFGYLPGGSEELITKPDTSIAALRESLRLLRPGGVITAVLYPGHAGGGEEAFAIQRWAEELPKRDYPSIVYRQLNAAPSAPYMIAIENNKQIKNCSLHSYR